MAVTSMSVRNLLSTNAAGTVVPFLKPMRMVLHSGCSFDGQRSGHYASGLSRIYAISRPQHDGEELKELNLSTLNGEEVFLDKSALFGLQTSRSTALPRALSAEEVKAGRAANRESGLAEYAALKTDLEKYTIQIGGLGIGYCLLAVSIESAISYLLGVAGSYLYLKLLFRDSDRISEDTVPKSFQLGFSKKKLGAQENIVRLVTGIKLALSSQRLIVPALMMALWAGTNHLLGDNTAVFQLELAPLLLGFFAYKGAALVQVYQYNKDLML